MNKTGLRRKSFITSASAANKGGRCSLFSTFSSLCFGVKTDYNYGNWLPFPMKALRRNDRIIDLITILYFYLIDNHPT
jgi:hypothetical protein